VTNRRTLLALALPLACCLKGTEAFAQAKVVRVPPTIDAEKLAKECTEDQAKAEGKYKGKILRVKGVVGDVYDDMLYLPTKVKDAGVSVIIRFRDGEKPDVKKGDEATFDGRFDLVAVLGPSLSECKLVPAETDKK